MTTPDPLRNSCLESLVHCLSSLTENTPIVDATGSALRRLRTLSAALQSLSSIAGEAATVELTLEGSLSLVETSQALLTTLEGPQYGGLGSAELARGLSEALTGLRDDIGVALRRQQADKVRGLYVIIDPEVTGGRDPMEIARAAVRGGARMLQLRDKLRDKGEILSLATPLQQLCQDNDVLLIINDHVDLGVTVGSAGIHVGQTDMPVAQARQVLAPHQILGRSNREMEQLVESQRMGADHVAFGAIYQTTTKGTGRPPQGPERLREAREIARVPLVAIGGINAQNVGPVVEAGADAVCVTAAVAWALEPEAAVTELVEAMRVAGGRI